MHSSLAPQAVVDTIGTLARRIEERFPGSGLSRVARELAEAGADVRARAARIVQPRRRLRLAVLLVSGGLVLAVAFGISKSRVPDEPFGLPELVQLTEAGANLIVLIGGAVLFLVTTERRLRRGQALAAIHELREFAHVVDMHQLTKDPYRTLHPEGRRTASSPRETLGPFELARYLDYCSEMFALIGKLAALYAKEIDDTEVVAAVNDVESLTTGLSRKVWQKLILLHEGDPVPAPPGAPAEQPASAAPE